MRVLKKNTLYCFSPPVMIITFLIEILLAIFTIWRYKLTRVTRIASVILILLAVFQLAEFNVCEGAFGITKVWWARLGFVAITFLPPLGLHLAAVIGRKNSKMLKTGVIAGYVLALVFSLYFLVVDNGITHSVCEGNYVIFALSSRVTAFYAAYYYGMLVASVIVAVTLARAQPKRTRLALHYLAMGYLLFMVPTTAANIIAPATLSAIPSVMCGFAVLLAIVLAGFVVPAAVETKRGVK